MKSPKGRKKSNKEIRISRKEALKKVGKYAAVTATSMFIILSPRESQAASPSPSNMPKW